MDELLNISNLLNACNRTIRPKKNLVKKFDELNDKRKLLSDDPAFDFLLINAGEEFNFRHLVNQILDYFFSVLNFCFFSFKRKEEYLLFIQSLVLLCYLTLNLPFFQNVF